MKNFRIIYIFIFILTLSFSAKSQIRIYHELGGSIGPALISGDWGRNTNIGKIFGYDGVEVNFVHNMQLVRSRWGLKSNFGFTYTQNKHNKDEWTGNNADDPSEQQKMLRAMSGSSSIITLGTQAEYNFIDFGMYYPRNVWTPYIAAGINVLYFMPTVTTPDGVPNIYIPDGIHEESGVTTSFKGAAGAKFKFSRFISVFGEFSLQRSYSDKIDGLVPNASTGTDYLSSFKIGVKYSFR